MEELNFKDVLTIIWRKKISIIVIITISIIIGSVYTFKYTTPRYKSSASVILGKVSSASNGEVLESEKDITMSDLNLNSSLIDTYSELVRSRSIMESVSQRLNHTISVDSLMESVSVARVGSSDLLQVTATNNDPVIAKNIVTEVVDVFSEYVKEIYKIENVYIIDQPSIEYVPYNINHVRDIAISILMGLIISILYVYIYSFVDNTVKSSKDIEELLNVKTLINIPFDKNKKEELITVNDSKSIISEAFKTLRTNIQFSNVDLKGAQTLLITSCLPSEGKSYVSANLAITFAQAGKKVILVDSDMRRGRQSKIFKVPNMNGLSNYISNIDSNGMEINWNLGEYIKRTDIKNLNIITAGSVPPNPAELLASARLNELIESLKNYYDIIIFDGAPILPITDSLILGRVLEKVMLVAENNKTKKDNLVKAKSNIEDVGGKVIGIALNKVAVSNGKYGDEYYYYYSSQDEKTNTVKEKICAFTREKIEKTHNCFENLVKKIKSLNKRISDVNKSEKMNKIEQRKIEAEKKKEVQRRIKAVEIEENKRKIQERKRQAEEKAKRDAEIAKMREAEKQRIEQERARQAEEKAKRDAEIAKMREAEKQKIEQERARQAEEKAKRDAEIAKMREAEKQRIEQERARQAEEKAKRDAEIAKMREAEKQRIEQERARQAEEKAKRDAEIAKKREAERLRKEKERLALEAERIKQAKIEAEERAKEDAIMAEEKARREQEEQQRREEERTKKIAIAEERAKERAQKRAEWNKKVNVFKGKALAKKDEISEEIKLKAEEYSKKYNDYKAIKAEENKTKLEEKAKRDAEVAKIREEEKIKREQERKIQAEEKAKKDAEITKIREEERKKRAEERKAMQAEKARLAAMQAEEKAKKEQELVRMREEERRKKEIEKIKLAEEKLRREEEAKYTEEYLVENLYPKTKYNKF